jgi:hypothetical protein
MTDKRLAWFGDNADALAMYYLFEELAHTWDDLVDKDKLVSEDKINKAFFICLVSLPSNQFYKYIQNAVLPMWVTIISSYQTANKFEKDKDVHGIEISHNLRYAAGHIIAYAVHVCVGPEMAKEIMPDVWKDIVHERFDDYRNEVLK